MKGLRLIHYTIILFVLITAGAFAIDIDDIRILKGWQPGKGKKHFIFTPNTPFLPFYIKGADGGDNSTLEYYLPVRVVLLNGYLTFSLIKKPVDPAYHEPAEVFAALPRDGIYLPYQINRCIWVNATATVKDGSNIIISGPFNGCTFGKCTGADGNLYVGHIYNNKSDKSDQDKQARDLETAAGAAANSLRGWKTKGLINRYKAKDYPEAYVMGIFADGTWAWKWVVLNHVTQKVINCIDITADGNWSAVTAADN